MEQLKVRVMATNELFVCSSGKMVLGTIRTSGICTLRIRAKKRKDEEMKKRRPGKPAGKERKWKQG